MPIWSLLNVKNAPSYVIRKLSQVNALMKLAVFLDVRVLQTKFFTMENVLSLQTALVKTTLVLYTK